MVHKFLVCCVKCEYFIVCDIGMELELLYPLILSIHKPYSHVMLQYPSLEQQLLINKLQKIKIVRLPGHGV